MNTANLQLEGLHLALAALVGLLRDKGVCTGAEIEAALRGMEDRLLAERGALREVSESNLDAVCFPLRFLRAAARAPAGEALSFNAVAAEIHRTKPRHNSRDHEGPES